MRPGPFATTVLRVTSGGFVWVLHFATIYGFTALACARGAAGVVPWLVTIATLAAAGACAAILFAAWKDARAFERWLSKGLAAAALLAILLESMPLLLVPPCA